MMQFDGHVPCLVKNSVGHVRKLYRLRVETMTANTEEDFGMYKHLQVYQTKEKLEKNQFNTIPNKVLWNYAVDELHVNKSSKC